MAGSRLFNNDFLAPDPREYDPRKCARYVFNGIGDTTARYAADVLNNKCGDMSLFISPDANKASVTAVSFYGTTSAGYTRLVVPASATLDQSRAWIGDRPTSQNSSMLLGDFESDCYARVRFDKSTDTSSNTTARVGFMQGHIAYDGVNAPYTAAMFVCYGSKTTWHVATAVNGDLADGVWKEIDTGISTSDWRVLGVHCNLGGTRLTFTIDGKVVYKEADPKGIPSRSTVLDQGGFPAQGAFIGAGLQSGVMARGRSAQTAGNEAKFDVDWIRTRHFFEGGR